MRRLVVALCVLSVASTARAHPLSFGVLDVDERSDGAYYFDFRYSGTEAALRDAELVLPPACHPTSPPTIVPLDNGVRRREHVRCARGLAARAVPPPARPSPRSASPHGAR